MIPKSLRYWFFAHFVIDIIFGIPLILFPTWTLNLFGFEAANLLLARLVGAALVAIGGTSLMIYKKDKSAYIPMLQLKLLWSGTAIVAIILSLNEGDMTAKYVILAIFASFFMVWFYYFKQLSK